MSEALAALLREDVDLGLEPGQRIPHGERSRRLAQFRANDHFYTRSLNRMAPADSVPTSVRGLLQEDIRIGLAPGQPVPAAVRGRMLDDRRRRDTVCAKMVRRLG